MMKFILPAVAVVFVALQFVRPDKNLSRDALGPDSMVERLAAPADIRALLASSCNDCHTDNTRYPWYAEIQPAGWFLARHVSEGREALNLSHFGKLGVKAQAKRLQYMIDAITDRDMPLASYTWIHRDAVLSQDQVRAFTTWAESAIAKLDK